MHDARGSLAVLALHGKVYALGGGQPQVNLDSIEVRMLLLCHQRSLFWPQTHC
jgi:hypothetical protein